MRKQKIEGLSYLLQLQNSIKTIMFYVGCRKKSVW